MRRAGTALCGVMVFGLAACGSTGGSGPAGRKTGSTPAPRLVRSVQVSSAGVLPSPVQLPAVAALPRRLLVMGGLDANDASTDAIVSIAGGRARVVGRLPQPLHDAAGAAVAGQAYFLGGGNAGATSAEVLRVAAGGTPVRAGALPVGASDVSAATVGQTVYVVGGYTGTVPLRSILAFNPGRHVRLVGRLPHPLRYAAVAAIGGRVLIAGGTDGTHAVRDVLSFDPAGGRVRRIGRLPTPLTHAAAAALGDRLYVLGGRGSGLDSQHRAILSIDPRTGSHMDVGQLPYGLSDLSAASLGGRIVAVGGRDASGRVHREVWTVRPRLTRRGPAAARTASRIPPLVSPRNVYAADRRLSPVVRHDPARVYVPNSKSDTVDVIDQRTGRIVDHFATGALPQHVTPAWDLRTLYVTNDNGNSLTPIDPRTGHHGRPLPVLDPYNLYFTADGRRAIVVAEAHRELDFRTPHTMRLTHALHVPQCAGVDHMDYTRDGRFALVSCEFAGRMIVVDLRRERVVRSVALRAGAMPQDVKLAPDGRTFYVADMASNGVWLIDPHHWHVIRFEHTGAGAHGLYPSRDARVLYVSNRGEGSISLISFRTRRPFRKWKLPGHASPDMGGVSVDGRLLWLSGRYDAEVYAIDTRNGRLVHRIPVGQGPHGMCVWPQPGRYSIGHTGILR